MAGKIIVDTLDTDNSFITLNVQQATVATMNANGIFSRTGTKMIGTDGSIGNSSISGATVSGNLNFDATGTTGIRLPAANTLVFYTAGTEDVRIDPTGNVGIGTSSPAYSLDVRSTAAPAIRLSRSGSAGQIASMVFEDGTATLGTGNTTRIASDSGAISFSTGGTSGAITGGTERLRIPANAAGITFPATQSASSDANTLDDYEEGTWSPTFTAGGSGITSIVYSNRYGTYTKVGRQVSIMLNMQVSNVGTGSGGVSISLPFTAQSGSSNYFICAAEIEGLVNAKSNAWHLIQEGQTKIDLYSNWYGTGGPTNINWSDFSTNTIVRISATYFV
jgi:hypothetical protein